jgi:hypothetical protein
VLINGIGFSELAAAAKLSQHHSAHTSSCAMKRSGEWSRPAAPQRFAEPIGTACCLGGRQRRLNFAGSYVIEPLGEGRCK